MVDIKMVHFLIATRIIISFSSSSIMAYCDHE